MKIQLTVLFFLVTVCIAGTAFESKQNKFSVSAKEALGKKLFNEKILSFDSTVSCTSCHKPNYAFADTTAFSQGIGGKFTNRNAPSVLNMKNRPYFFWDGRAASLAQQALMPIQNENEMGLPIAKAIERLIKNDTYKNLFLKVFNQLPNAQNIGESLAAYEQTLETSNSKFDAWSNDDGSLSIQEERGRQLFIGDKAKCFNCHFQEDFTNDDFKNIGIFDGKNYNDSGLFKITKSKKDIGKFKTPSLRNIAVTAPYMHNGMFKTLEEVIDYYNNPKKIIPNSKNIDNNFQNPLGLTHQEKKDLISFLKTLTDKKYMAILK